MVEAGVATFFVFFFAHVGVGGQGWVENFAAFESAIVEGSGDTDGTDGIEAIGVLYHGEFI